MIRCLLQDQELARRLGDAARRHVKQNFSRQVFGQKLIEILADMTAGPILLKS